MELKQKAMEALTSQRQIKQGVKTKKIISIKVEHNPQSIFAKTRMGHWRKHEQVKYVLFLRRYFYIMKSGLLRYHYRIFTKMAEDIGTRDAVQCKSHHQKILKKFNYRIEKLIFGQEIVPGPVIIGKGEDGNHFQSVLEGIKHVDTNEKRPNLVVQTAGRILILLDTRYIQNY